MQIVFNVQRWKRPKVKNIIQIIYFWFGSELSHLERSCLKKTERTIFPAFLQQSW
jgi:hypothetical protein